VDPSREPCDAPERRQDEHGRRVVYPPPGLEAVKSEEGDHQDQPAETPAGDRRFELVADVEPRQPVPRVQDGQTGSGDQREIDHLADGDGSARRRDCPPDGQREVQAAECDDDTSASDQRKNAVPAGH